ncbi:hypothetical protein XENOCAPTIV_013514, partial [Xenoophorus captivus]
LTSWAVAADEEIDEKKVDVAAMTLLEVEQQLLGGSERQAEKLALLQVLAVMLECLQHDKLLRRTSQVNLSSAPVAGCGLHGVLAPEGLCWPGCGLRAKCWETSGEPDAEHGDGPGCDSAVCTSETFPLTQQLSSEDYSCMSRLLPPLEALSQQHPDVVIQELASNLRAIIATHGAYRPEKLADAAQSSRNPEGTPKKNKMNSDGKKQETPASTHSRFPQSSQHPSPAGRGGTSSSDDPDPNNKRFSDWLLEACDPEVPTRAFALRVLTQRVQRRDPEAVQAQEKVLTVCVLLTDSFVTSLLQPVGNETRCLNFYTLSTLFGEFALCFGVRGYYSCSSSRHIFGFGISPTALERAKHSTGSSVL